MIDHNKRSSETHGHGSSYTVCVLFIGFHYAGYSATYPSNGSSAAAPHLSVAIPNVERPWRPSQATGSVDFPHSKQEEKHLKVLLVLGLVLGCEGFPEVTCALGVAGISSSELIRRD